jgi:saxitoxin biosynthesis operon SxtJ-like protein
MTATHENFDREIKPTSSDRSFGFVFAAVFAIVAGWPLTTGSGPHLWALALAALFLVIAIVRPRLLQPLNRLWFKVSLVLHHVVTPIVMGVIFVLAVLPTALIMRTRRRDPLRLNPRRRRETNWVVRTPPGPSPDTMKHLF